MTDDGAPIHVDVFAAFGRDDAGIAIVAEPGYGKQLTGAAIPPTAPRWSWLHTPLRLIRRHRPPRGVQR